MSEFDPFVAHDEGYLVAQNDLTDRGSMFERAPILPVVRRLEEFALAQESSEASLESKTVRR